MDITPDMLLNAYAMGIFPMAPDRDSNDLEWYSPEYRGVLPLSSFHLPRRLARTVSAGGVCVTSDTAFEAVLEGCAEAAIGRETTWISDRIRALYTKLYRRGAAHSIEVWNGGQLVGGLYGVSIGGAFFGESMFSRATDMSKIALVHLVANLRCQGYVLLDTQYPTAHLERFGVTEIPASHYRALLNQALPLNVAWCRDVGLPTLGAEIHLMRGDVQT